MDKNSQVKQPAKKFIEVIYLAASAASVLGFTLILARTSRPTQYNDRKQSEQLARIQEKVQSLVSQTEAVTNQFKVIQKQLDTALYDPNNLINISFQSDIDRVSSELKSLKESLGSDIERSLSVPLLRKDIQKIEEQLEERTAAASKEIDRIYDQNKWFIGLMGTMSIGLLGLAISNLLQTRRKETDA